MHSYELFLHLSFLVSSILCNKPCSREASRLVRDYFTRAFGPIYEKNQIAIPLECVLSPMRDLFYRQELNKVKLSYDKWLCKYCNKTFYSEFYLDLHFTNRHNDTLLSNDQTVCLANYCSIFRCDVLKRPKKSLRSLNPLARRSQTTKQKKRKIINEQQLTTLRTHCASVINRCIPQNVHYDARVKLHNQMYAEVCAYLTSKRYFELPAYQKPLINFTSIFCLVIFVGTCLVGIGVVTHSDWKLDDHDDYPVGKLLTEDENSQTISCSACVSTNTTSHSLKSPDSSLRQRSRFKGHEGGCQHGHSHDHHHDSASL